MSDYDPEESNTNFGVLSCVCEKFCSFSLLQSRLLIDGKTTSQVLSILEGLGIISFDYKVLINDIDELERVLDILFENHRRKFHDKS